MAMPISTRSDRSRRRQRVHPHPGARARRDPTRRSASRRSAPALSVTKEERALGFTELLAGLVNVLPTSLLVRVAKAQVETVDFTTSNVRGAPWPLYIAGAQIEANYPLGPVAGTAFNLTTLSYNGSLDMGLHVDRAAIDDPELLQDLHRGELRGAPRVRLTSVRGQDPATPDGVGVLRR